MRCNVDIYQHRVFFALPSQNDVRTNMHVINIMLYCDTTVSCVQQKKTIDLKLRHFVFLDIFFHILYLLISHPQSCIDK